MNIHLTSDQERIIKDEIKSGHFRSVEEVIAEALVALREKASVKLCRQLQQPS